MHCFFSLIGEALSETFHFSDCLYFFRPLYGQRCLSISWNWVTTMKLTVQWSAIQTHLGKQLMFKYNLSAEKHLFESLMTILQVLHNQCINTCNILCSFVEYRRKDCLRQLLVTLCERGDLQTLVGFPYIDLQDEVSFFLL